MLQNVKVFLIEYDYDHLVYLSFKFSQIKALTLIFTENVRQYQKHWHHKSNLFLFFRVQWFSQNDPKYCRVFWMLCWKFEDIKLMIKAMICEILESLRVLNTCRTGRDLSTKCLIAIFRNGLHFYTRLCLYSDLVYIFRFYIWIWASVFSKLAQREAGWYGIWGK